MDSGSITSLRSMIVCAPCNTYFNSKKALDQHRKDKKCNKMSCVKCTKNFINSLALEQHNKMKHGPRFKCMATGKVLDSVASVQAHVAHQS